jgi:hypothetical protein
MSDESIDLIRKMLDRDLSTRPTMAQVIAHPVLPFLGLVLHVVVLRCHSIGLGGCTLEQVNVEEYMFWGMCQHNGGVFLEFGYIGVIIDGRHQRLGILSWKL